jgi:hypothetical protein
MKENTWLNHFYNNKTEMELLMKESRKFQLKVAEY